MIVFSSSFVMAAKKWCIVSEALEELAAQRDSDDDFDGDWCDSDGNLNLHGDDVG